MKETFMGMEVSKYAKERGWVDYGTLSACFDCALDNSLAEDIEWFELVNGDDDDAEIFEYFLIDESGADILKHFTSDIVYFDRKRKVYVWGITFWGTIWDYVLTEISLDTE